jgi:hypothetical protein
VTHDTSGETTRNARCRRDGTSRRIERSRSGGAGPRPDNLNALPFCHQRGFRIADAQVRVANDVQPAAFRDLPHHFFVVRDDVWGTGEEVLVPALRCLEVADRNTGEENIEIHQQYVPLLHPVGRGDAVGVIGRPLDQLDPVAVGIDDPCRSEVV